MSESKSSNRLIYDDSFIKFNEKIAIKYGFDIAVIIGVFIRLEIYFEDNPSRSDFFKKTGGYFFCMAKYMEKRNGMSEKRMRRAISTMESEKIIFTKKWAKNWKLYKINHEVLSKVTLNTAKEYTEDRKLMYYEFDEVVRMFDEI